MVRHFSSISTRDSGLPCLLPTPLVYPGVGTREGSLHPQLRWGKGLTTFKSCLGTTTPTYTPCQSRWALLVAWMCLWPPPVLQAGCFPLPRPLSCLRCQQPPLARALCS